MFALGAVYREPPHSHVQPPWVVFRPHVVLSIHAARKGGYRDLWCEFARVIVSIHVAYKGGYSRDCKRRDNLIHFNPRLTPGVMPDRYITQHTPDVIAAYAALQP